MKKNRNIIFSCLLLFILLLSGCLQKESGIKQDSLVGQDNENKQEFNNVNPVATSVEDLNNENTDIDTSDWNIYKSEKYGVELAVPKSWKIKEEEGIVRFIPSVSDEWSCSDGSLTINNNPNEIDEFINNAKGDFFDGMYLTRIYKRRNVAFNGYKAEILTETNAMGCDFPYYYVYTGNGNYLISFESSNDIHDAMLDNLKIFSIID